MMFKDEGLTKLYLNIQFVPRSKYSFSVMKVYNLMLYVYKKIFAVCSELHTRHAQALCGQKVEIFNTKPGGTCSNQWALKG
jgi:hypothetical protein